MIAVFDNFITDENLIKEINDDPNFYIPTGVYKYWKGWWDSDPSNVKQRLIKYIWEDHIPINISLNIDGFEHWTGIQRADEDGRRNYLELHIDDDVAYRLKTGNRITPILGCVYYPPGSDFKGGDLKIYTDGVEQSPEVIKAKANRLVIFSPGEVTHEVSVVTEGVRRAIAINLWATEPWSVKQGHIILENDRGTMLTRNAMGQQI